MISKFRLWLFLLPIMSTSCNLAEPKNPGNGAGDYQWPALTLQSSPLAELNSQNFSQYTIDLNAYSYKIIVISNYTETLSCMDPAWWHDAVMYEVFSPTFNDGALPTSRLDYLKDMGFDGIWTTPIFDSPSEHGYDATDFYHVKESMGGNTAFSTYVSEAHSRGLKIVLDLALNHSGNQCQWFIDSALKQNGKEDWYIWTNAGADLTAWTSPVNSYVNAWRDTSLNSNEKYYSVFGEIHPDLNLRNPHVTQELRNVARFWMEHMDVDGFRLDAVRYLIETGPGSGGLDTAETMQWLIDFQTYLNSIKSDAYTVAEVWADFWTMGQYYVSGIPSRQEFNFPFCYAWSISLTNETNSVVNDMIQNWKPGFTPWHYYASMTDNHDYAIGYSNHRILDFLGNNIRKAKLLAALQLTFPGTPYIYYGSEIGMTKGPENSDAAKRAPMDWDQVAVQSADPDSLLNTYRNLIALRKKYSGLRRGDIRLIANHDPQIISYIRPGNDVTLLYIANLSSTNIRSYLDFTGSGLSSTGHYPLMQVYGDQTTVLNPKDLAYDWYLKQTNLARADALNDELLSYPTNYTYVDGVGDITVFTISTYTNLVSSKVVLEVEMAEMINSWSGSHGFDHTCSVIYFQKPSSTSTNTNFWSFSRDWRSELFYKPESGWDFCVIASGNGAALYGPDSTNLLIGLEHHGSTLTKTIRIEVPGSVLGLDNSGNISGWKVVLFSQDWEDWGYGSVTPESPISPACPWPGGYRGIAQTNVLSEWNYQALDMNWDTETAIIDMLGNSTTNTCIVRWINMPDSEWLVIP